MWEQVKPITLLLEQDNEDGSRFLMQFYSHDYELIRLKEASHFDKHGVLIGDYSRLVDVHCECKYDLNFFVERLSRKSTQQLVEYFENPNIYIEYYF
jgi:hypothetical protein